jgi:aldehyde dehydrogenase (NAD+)
MRDDTKFYIDGAWLDATGLPTLDVINPATEKVAGRIALGTVADVDHAVAAASYFQLTRHQSSLAVGIEEYASMSSGFVPLSDDRIGTMLFEPACFVDSTAQKRLRIG